MPQDAPDLYAFPAAPLKMLGRERMFDTGRLQFSDHCTYFEMHFLTKFVPSRLKIGLLNLPLFLLTALSITLLTAFHFAHLLFIDRAAHRQSKSGLMLWSELWLDYMGMVLGEARSSAVRMALMFTFIVGVWALLMQFVTRYLESALTGSISTWLPWKVLQTFDDMLQESEFAQFKFLILKQEGYNQWLENFDDPRIGQLR